MEDNFINKMDSKPASSIPLEKKEVEVFDDLGLIRQCEKYWASKGAYYEKSYLKGVELGKTYLYKEEQKFNILDGALQAILENVGEQISNKDELTFDQKQELLVTLNLQKRAIASQIEALRDIKIDINKKHLRSILHGYITAFLILTDYDNQN